MLNINDLRKLYLGARGENNAQTLTIDVRPWLVSYPNGSIAIWHKRNGYTVPEPVSAVFDKDKGTVEWTPTETDTFVEGIGEAEIRLYENGVIKKTKKIITGVSATVTGAGLPLGSGWQSYIDAVERAAQVAILKKGQINFEINEHGHLIMWYTDQIPITEGGGASE